MAGKYTGRVEKIPAFAGMTAWAGMTGLAPMTGCATYGLAISGA
jgi:hypothetical protein